MVVAGASVAQPPASDQHSTRVVYNISIWSLSLLSGTELQSLQFPDRSIFYYSWIQFHYPRVYANEVSLGDWRPLVRKTKLCLEGCKFQQNLWPPGRKEGLQIEFNQQQLMSIIPDETSINTPKWVQRTSRLVNTRCWGWGGVACLEKPQKFYTPFPILCPMYLFQ